MLLLSLALSCASRTAPAPAAPAAAEPEPTAAVGVASPALRALLVEHWNATMERFPVWAGELGDRRFDGALYDPSPEARAAWMGRVAGWKTAAEGLADLAPTDVLTRDLLVFELGNTIASEACQAHRWSVSARDNALVNANRLADAPRLDTPADAEVLLAQYRALPAMIDAEAANLRSGLAAGQVGIAASIEKVVAQIEAQLALPVSDSPLYKPAAAEIGGDVEAWRASLREVIEGEVRPALGRYVEVLRGELLPQARRGDQIGLHALPSGDDCYRALARSHTTTELSPHELHELGLAELESIHREFREIGPSAIGESDLASIFERLRTDPALRFDTAGEVRQTAEDALGRAEAAMPGWFGRLPQAECVVDVIPDYLAPYTTIAYYQPVRPDGSRPGIYYVNAYEPETRPRHEAEVLAFHESIPGHHLQIAIQQELGDIPAFRRYGGVTAFVEGWALYTERLADEMGLYSGDVDRLGMLSFDAWRASRLVVDTGIHAKGWTRAQAEAFMEENTPLAINNIANEVDRYVTTPGQALAYKVGQLEIARLRREAEESLGDRFEIAAFHDQILGAGPLPLGLLAERIQAWIDSLEG